MKQQQEARKRVKFLIENGENDPKKCAQMRNVSLRTVFRVKKRMMNGQTIAEGHRSGCPENLDSEAKRSISEFTIKIEKCCRYLKNHKWFKIRPAAKQYLNEQQKANRVAWCQKYQNTDWDSVDFTDESYFYYYRNKIKVWTKSKCRVKIPKHSPSIIVWGVLSSRGLTPLKIGCGTVNSETFVNILNECLILTIDMLYPDGSPDLNPIENLWAIIKDRLEKETNVSIAN
ncbi:hypothetical protein B4U79_08758 [Dinothrombium tinctorium]|uniref:Tc1-like transposase DDE domain-containing protein n=1 Tax=Dinothrombium tinctorium TaxID=1965070 RepID=A0A3S3NHA3_9ACAR|nr:hypothetical protein B4U79_08758 [Dinothrombium tinctorium]